MIFLFLKFTNFWPKKNDFYQYKRIYKGKMAQIGKVPPKNSSKSLEFNVKFQ
jgi:hypothetical protein